MKQSVLFIIIVNLLLTTAVVAVAFSLQDPGSPAAGTPSESETIGKRVADIEERLAGLRERLDRTDLSTETLRAELDGVRREVAELPRIATDGAVAGIGATAPDAEKAAALQMGKMFQNIMQSQIKRQRDRFIKDLTNPTPESEARQARQMNQIVSRVAEQLELDQRDRTEVQRILTDVDNRRREALRGILRAHASVDDVPYGEVKKVLDDSWSEEDRMLAESLSPEKVEEYKQAAGPFRELFDVGARALFPDKQE